MRFWDSSALVPFFVEESRSVKCRALLRRDEQVAVWALTRTEIVSAIRRAERDGGIPRPHAASALRRVQATSERWNEVDALGPVRERAERLLGGHRLRAADALQLAAALVLVRERPSGRAFVTADRELARAAEAEGFAVTVV